MLETDIHVMGVARRMLELMDIHDKLKEIARSGNFKSEWADQSDVNGGHPGAADGGKAEGGGELGRKVIR